MGPVGPIQDLQFTGHPTQRRALIAAGILGVLVGVALMTAEPLGGLALALVVTGLVWWRLHKWGLAQVRVAPDGTMTVVDLRGGGGTVSLAHLASVEYLDVQVMRFQQRFFVLTDTDGRTARLSVHRGWGNWTHERRLWQVIADSARASRARVGHRAGRLLFPDHVPLLAPGYDEHPFGRPG